MSKNKVYLLLGSNIEDRKYYLQQAIIEISQKLGDVKKKSEIYQTDSWGYNDSPYLNQVIEIVTELEPSSLLQQIHLIESSLGRKRTSDTYQARTIDIDILFYNSEVIKLPDLQIPHKLLHLRRFVLIPMCDIDKNFIHPVLNKTMSELLDICPDKGNVVRYFL